MNKHKRICWYFFILALSVAISASDAKETNTLALINTLIVKGESYRQKGYLREAERVFSQVLTATEASPDSKPRSLATGLLGNLYLQQRRHLKAKPLLDKALAIAEKHNWPGLTALYNNYLGNYYSSQQKWSMAKRHYKTSVDWALKVNDPALTVQAKLNLARLAKRQGDTKDAWTLLQSASRTLVVIPSSSEKIDVALQAGYQILTIKATDKIDESERVKLAYEILTDVLTLAEQHQDLRGLSLCQGYLGQLYESQTRWDDALAYAEMAIQIAEKIDAKDLLLKWEWQRGRILKALDRPQLAISAYRRAVDYIEAVRIDIPIHYQHGRSSFRDTLEPVYLGLADLLLQQADQLGISEMKHLLHEARQTVERIKKTELEDYFQNRCVIQAFPKVNLENVAPKTATIYPIMLPDRLEILIGVGSDIFHRTVSVAATKVKARAKTLARYLRRRQYPKDSARKLYRWLIEPAEDILKRYHIDTLVVIPDGELRLVPLAALFDGDKYLIEDYAIVTSPGLSLFDPKPIPRENFKALLAGLSQPGPVIKTLPAPRLHTLVSSIVAQSDNEVDHQRSRDIGGLLDSRGQPNRQLKILTANEIQDLLNNPAILEKTQQALALPGVEKEIESLSKMFPSTPLINEKFVSQRLNEEILKSPYRIVHIASHGFFGKSSEKSFIMAYDRILTMDHLEMLLHSDKFQKAPIELLTLSACQTAEGDDRSPLGLSGMALKAKVRSVLGSLWPVSDAATVQLMKAFYQRLNSKDITKAQALRQAQISLLNDKRRAHPFFWSPFILIGNWL